MECSIKYHENGRIEYEKQYVNDGLTVVRKFDTSGMLIYQRWNNRGGVANDVYYGKYGIICARYFLPTRFTVNYLGIVTYTISDIPIKISETYPMTSILSRKYQKFFKTRVRMVFTTISENKQLSITGMNINLLWKDNIHENFHATIIQRWWKQVRKNIYNPYTSVGKRRINRLYDELAEFQSKNE